MVSSLRYSSSTNFSLIILFRYSGKTEFQTSQLNKARRTVQFERRPSQRFAKRQSHIVREKMAHLYSASATQDASSNVPETKEVLINTSSENQNM